MKNLHAQCNLRKEALSQVTWLPIKFASLGQIVRLYDGSEWSDNWRVDAVYTVMESSDVNEHSRGYKKHHYTTDAVRDKDGRWLTPGSR